MNGGRVAQIVLQPPVCASVCVCVCVFVRIQLVSEARRREPRRNVRRMWPLACRGSSRGF